MADGAPALGLPSSNRGVSETERIGVVLDWLSFSVDVLAVLEARGLLDNRTTICSDLDGIVGGCAPMVSQAIKAHFFGELFDLGEQGKGRFYAWRFPLGDGSGNHVGLVEFGGVNTLRQDGTRTARVELTGLGCRLFEASGEGDHAERWSRLASLLGVCDARISRIDIAADDFRGAYSIQWAIDRYTAGEFDRRGQRPKARLIDDLGNGTGKTFYIGSRKSENQLRVYEKGKEQGDPDSPWMRYEGEFHASNRRALPLEMMIDPAPYLVGAYPVLEFVDGIGERLRIATAEVLANCKRAVTHFRRQYGPMLNAMLHASGGDEVMLSRLIIGTARSTLPAWCPRPDDAAQLLAAILFAPSEQDPDSPDAASADADSFGQLPVAGGAGDGSIRRNAP